MEMPLTHIFCGVSKVCVKLAWHLDENISLVTPLLSISRPCFHFSLLSCICLPLSSHLSAPPLFIPLPSLAPLSPLFYLSSPSFSTQSSIYFSASEHYRAVRVNGVPVSGTGQVMNLTPPPLLSSLEPGDTELFYHPAQRGQDRAGWRSVGAGPG